MSKALRFVFQLVLISVVIFGLHYLIHSITKDLYKWDSAYMHLWQIYALQLLLSVIVIITVVGISKSLPQHIGYVFLGVLTLKLIANYFIINSALLPGSTHDFFKHNFLIVFFVYMFFDVYVTYCVLNQSSSTKK